jgi:hypothetical protein
MRKTRGTGWSAWTSGSTSAEAGGKMVPNKQMVFDAQMAVGDPGKYPEFKGNVRSIDTRLMTFPIAECPGGRDRYKGHADSYLKIGEAMGKAMLELPVNASE